MKRLFLLVLLFPVLAAAQVQKCTIDGKVVYSDSLCGQRGQAVNTNANSIDSSGLRDLADQQRQRDAAEKEKMANARPRGGKPGPCDYIKYAGAAPTPEEANKMKDCALKASKDILR